MDLTFLGATGTVTGSRYLVESGGSRLLLDCGLFQGGRELCERNWQPFPVPPREIDAVVLSHGHIDHTGYLPKLIQGGFHGETHATPATRDLCAILLPDSARLMEEEAEYRNRKGLTRHKPALPLYTEAEAGRAAERIRPHLYRAPFEAAPGMTISLLRAGHILGSSMVHLRAGGITLLYTGDLGRQDPLLLKPPAEYTAADYLLLESTYGDRLHEERDPRAALTALIRKVAARGGVIVIPAFAVGRTQEVLFILRELEDAGAVPVLPVVVDSPMATDVTALFKNYPDDLEQDVTRFGERALRPRKLRFTRSVAESKALNAQRGPAIVIAGSGMATGGRVLHHLSHRLPDARNAVLLAGYQGGGTRGRLLLDGAKELRIFKEDIPVRAEIVNVDAFSAHADADELIDWLRSLPRPPKQVFLIHGEDPARQALAARIHAELGWDALAPSHGERVRLD